MTTYLDSSVVLRVVLREEEALGLAKGHRYFTSELTHVETLRTLDRMRFRKGITDAELSAYRQTAIAMLHGIDRARITPEILSRAADPFPTPLGTLDAIHLATALLWNQASEGPLSFATHDKELAMAARACGIIVLGA